MMTYVRCHVSRLIIWMTSGSLTPDQWTPLACWQADHETREQLLSVTLDPRPWQWTLVSDLDSLSSEPVSLIGSYISMTLATWHWTLVPNHNAAVYYMGDFKLNKSSWLTVTNERCRHAVWAAARHHYNKLQLFHPPDLHYAPLLLYTYPPVHYLFYNLLRVRKAQALPRRIPLHLLPPERKWLYPLEMRIQHHPLPEEGSRLHCISLHNGFLSNLYTGMGSRPLPSNSRCSDTYKLLPARRSNYQLGDQMSVDQMSVDQMSVDQM